MYYTESEIVNSFLRSGRKASQIKILAELNTTGMDNESLEIAKHNVMAVLKKNGVLKDTKQETGGKKKETQATHEKKLLPAVIPPEIKMFESPVKRIGCWRRITGRITGRKIVIKMTKQEETKDSPHKPDMATGGDDSKKTKQAAGAENEYTAEEFRKGFLFMANFVADCITEMDKTDPNAPGADRLRESYIRDIEDVQQFLSEMRIKKDDDASD